MRPSEQKGAMPENENVSEETCARCGMEEGEWSTREGVQQGDDVYCCEGCASGGECTCA
jgi:hypothetical protein